MKFYKYTGLGNDFIIFNNLDGNIQLNKENIIKLCDRHFGIGADGIVLASASNVSDIGMEIYNSDGSRAEMCGNASRCFAKYLYEKGIVRKNEIHVETDAGMIVPVLNTKDDIVVSVKVNMGKPIFDPKLIPCTIDKNQILNHEIRIDECSIFISTLFMGVPHTVIITDNMEDSNIIKLGSLIENSDYFPNKTNVNFISIINKNEIILKTWERGAGYTYACGTGACASVVAGNCLGHLDNKVLVHLRGGDLTISWSNREYVYMEGVAQEVFQGSIEI